jgi:hypothetical protein
MSAATIARPRLDEPVAATSTVRSRVILVISSIVATLVAVNVLVVLLEPYMLWVVRYDQQHTAARIVEYYAAPPPDIIFMGTSRALSGFDPTVVEQEIESQTGVHTYAHNMGLTGGTIEIHYLMLKNIIRDDKKPKVIVYGLTDSEFVPVPVSPVDYLPYTNVLLRPDDFWKFSGNTIESKIAFWVKQILPIYRDRRILMDALSIAFNPYDPAHKYFAPGPDHKDPSSNGFIPGSGDARATASWLDENRREYAPILGGFKFDYTRLDTLDKFIDLADSRGIKVVLVTMPVDAELRKLWDNDQRIDEFRAALQVVAGEHGVPLLDLYRGWDGFPEDGLWDYHHLNEVGAGAVSKLVADTELVPLFGGAAVAQAPPLVIQAKDEPRPVVATRQMEVQALFPDSIAQGDGFNVQPDGESAIAVRVRNASRSSSIVFAGMTLDTVYNPNNLLTATVPGAKHLAPGQYPVYVADGDSVSNSIDFVVNGR